jgi:hypothetical protein
VTRWCAVSVDLDEMPHYHRIHGLPLPSAARAHPVYDRAVERFVELGAELDVPLTFFVVGADTERPSNAALLRSVARAGHELGNHSKNHLYDLARLDPDAQRVQVGEALELIEANVGVRPNGFRAPGYTVTDELLEIVAQSGHAYDSSVFPCPPYYAAKAVALAALALRGRQSDSILDSPSVLRAPTRPYRTARPYFVRGGGLPEFPIQVTPGPRLPYIGTGLVLAGQLGARLLTELVVGERFVNLELHGIDLLGCEDGLEALRGYQPDARLSWRTKRSILRAQLERLQRAGYAFVRLIDATRLPEVFLD